MQFTLRSPNVVQQLRIIHSKIKNEEKKRHNSETQKANEKGSFGLERKPRGTLKILVISQKGSLKNSWILG